MKTENNNTLPTMSRFYYRIFILLAVALLSVIDAAALSDRTPGIIKSSLMGLEYDVRAGLSIGGATPIPLPREIREIESFRVCLKTNVNKKQASVEISDTNSLRIV